MDDMRVVLQEKVVQVFGDERRHAGICQGCEEYDIRRKAELKTLSSNSSKLFNKIKLLPSLLKFK